MDPLLFKTAIRNITFLDNESKQIPAQIIEASLYSALGSTYGPTTPISDEQVVAPTRKDRHGTNL